MRLRRSGSRRQPLVVAVGTVLLIASLWRVLAVMLTDRWWYQAMGFDQVWRTVVLTKLALASILTLGFFASMWASLAFADRIGDRLAFTLGPSLEPGFSGRLSSFIEGNSPRIRFAIAAFLALSSGSGGTRQWNNALLFLNARSWGENDATFGRDIGFFVFRLPLLTYLSEWFTLALIVVTVVTAIWYLLRGGLSLINFHSDTPVSMLLHATTLLIALALAKLIEYRVSRYRLVLSSRGPVNGASYTDVNVTANALDVMIVVTLAAAAMCVLNLRRKDWSLLATALVLWASVALSAVHIAPTAVEVLKVDSHSSSFEIGLIRNNIEATREAFGLAATESRRFSAKAELTSTELDAAAANLGAAELWDDSPMRLNFDSVQKADRHFNFEMIDHDVYPIDGVPRPVIVGVRTPLEGSIENGSDWEAKHVLATHGEGLVVANSAVVGPKGSSELEVTGIPPKSRHGLPPLTQPDVFVGEGFESFALVGTRMTPLDIDGSVPDPANWDTGISMGGQLKRAIIATRVGDFRLVTSPLVGPNTHILLNRDVRERVRAVAPFLTVDSNPVPVISGGRIVYLVDAYTTSDSFPNSERVPRAAVDRFGALAGGEFNYIRHSVTAAVDSYDGSVILYERDRHDPVLLAYRSAFPGLIRPLNQMPAGLRDHLSYPDDLFRVQSRFWSGYRVEDPERFLSEDSRWFPARNPSVTDSEMLGQTPEEDLIPPGLTLGHLPGDSTQSFARIRSYSGVDPERLVGFLAGTPDGRLVAFSTDDLVDSPAAATVAMNEANGLKQLRTGLGKQADLIPGQIRPVLVGSALLYVRSVFSFEAKGPPRILAVMVARANSTQGRDEVGIGPQLGDALVDLFGHSPASLATLNLPTEKSGGQVGVADDESRLAAAVDRTLQEAETALDRGDVAGYQAAVRHAKALSKQLNERLKSEEAPR